MLHKVISVVISYNSEKYLTDCIDSVAGQSYSNQKIVVIDNASENSPQKIISNYDSIGLVVNDYNYGYAYAVNVGFKIALALPEFKYIFILNPDIILELDVLDSLVSILSSDENIAAVGPKILDGRWECRGRGTDIQTVEWLCGCAILFNVDAIRKNGLFDESYFLYYEETDYLHRLIENKYRLIRDDRVIVHHVGGAITGRYPTKTYYYMIRNIFKFAYKNIFKKNKVQCLRYILSEIRNKVYFPMNPLRMLALSLGIIRGLAYFFMGGK